MELCYDFNQFAREDYPLKPPVTGSQAISEEELSVQEIFQFFRIIQDNFSVFDIN